jgi:catechol 2,3-dioxygenase-like lactoylglutathione lyase family enzyme
MALTATTDANRARHFYEDALGLSLDHVEPGASNWCSGSPERVGCG